MYKRPQFPLPEERFSSLGLLETGQSNPMQPFVLWRLKRFPVPQQGLICDFPYFHIEGAACVKHVHRTASKAPSREVATGTCRHGHKNVHFGKEFDVIPWFCGTWSPDQPEVSSCWPRQGALPQATYMKYLSSLLSPVTWKRLITSWTSYSVSPQGRIALVRFE